MSYLEPFQSVALFENTFRHQLNKKTGKIDERKFVFDKTLRGWRRPASGCAGPLPADLDARMPALE